MNKCENATVNHFAVRWVFNPFASSLTLICLISKQNMHTLVFRLRTHTCTEEAVVLCNIPALVLPFLWELQRHKLCSFLLHSLFLQGQPEGLLVSTSVVTQSMTLNLCCGHFSCSSIETLGGKVSGLSAPAFCWAPCPLSWRSALETLAFLVAEKSLKTWNLTVFLSVTHDFLP